MAAYEAPLSAAIAASSSGANTVVSAPGAGQRIQVFSYVIVASGAVTAQWRSGATTAESGAMSLATNGGVSATAGDPETPLFTLDANEALNLQLGGAVGVAGHVAYRVVPV